MGTGQGNAAPPGAGGATREDRAMIHLFHRIAGLTGKVDGASLNSIRDSRMAWLLERGEMMEEAALVA
jgi:hypothetical protein